MASFEVDTRLGAATACVKSFDWMGVMGPAYCILSIDRQNLLLINEAVLSDGLLLARPVPTPDVTLTGHFKGQHQTVDLDAILSEIHEAEVEATRRKLALEGVGSPNRSADIE